MAAALMRVARMLALRIAGTVMSLQAALGRPRISMGAAQIAKRLTELKANQRHR
jgi:hypothetical protein